MSIDKEFINELLSIEAFAESLKQRATGLRKRYQSEMADTPRKGQLSTEDKKNLISGFDKQLSKNAKSKIA